MKFERRRSPPGLLRHQAGFTLLEIMTVVIIIGLLTGFAISAVKSNLDKARQEATKAMIGGTLRNGLNLFEMDNGHYPTTDQGLKALIEKPADAANWRPYLDTKAIPKDPWNQDYIYACPGQHNPDTYDLSSKGKDPNKTEDDIHNW